MNLKIFAFHVSEIMIQPVGNVFILFPCQGVRVKVEILGEDNVRMNGIWCGNRQGARDEFVRLVEEAT